LIKILGEVRDGKFIPDTPQYFKDAVSEHEGKRIEVWIGRETIRRSRRFNSLYFAALVSVFAEYTGYTNEQAHEILKAETIGMEAVEYQGKTYMIPRRTRYMNAEEFKDFVSTVELYLLENGVIEGAQLS
jgi:hypothetical protein